ncbi:MAG: hypothetical protein ACM3H8_16690 [Sphingobacteriales bacterium]
MPKPIRNIIVSLLLITLSGLYFQAPAQEGVPIEVKKPPLFESKILKSEKTGEKKFTLPRKLMQNTASHYNFYFNAKNKFDAIIERATDAQRDDFSKLLSFYGYSLDITSNEKSEIDSILLKCTAGILLHDLRNSWVDNLYLLIGKAYLIRKDFDSAQMTFQFINYNFHPSRKETDKVYIGSNNNGSTGSINVVTKEKGGIVRKVFSTAPSRNDALLWQTRNYIEMNQLVEASALLDLLKTDKNFPSRLNPFYSELLAYIFYKQEQWDSAAVHYEKALDNAINRQDLARREYLLAQLLTKANDPKKASNYFNKSSNHTTNLLMAIHADLNEAQLLRGTDDKDILSTINDLLKMAHRDKYDAYRDLLYYSAAQLQLKLKDTASAINTYQKSINKAVAPNFEYHNKSYIQLSAIAFNQKNYRLAASCIDSVQLADESIADMQEELEKRKFILHQVAKRTGLIEREDSLQKLAKLPEAELDVLLKKLVKKLRKEQGLKEEAPITSNPAVNKAGGQVNDLFSGGSTDKGEWYFYNAAAKARGFSEFIAKWGKRTNTDNWRRIGAVNSKIISSGGDNQTTDDNNTGPGSDKYTGEINVEALKATIPFTEEQLQISNDTIASSLFVLGGLYKNALEDYGAAAETYEQLYQRFPEDKYAAETVFNLYYCWLKAGNKDKSDYYKSILQNKYTATRYNNLLQNFESGAVKSKDAATQKYEQIYDLMLSGKFDEAFAEKKKADSVFGNNNWTPQLLYVEALYHIKQKQDSMAIDVLDKLTLLYPSSPLFEKAQNMKEVLSKRSEIENYLTNLQVTRAEEEQVIVPEDIKNLTTTKEQKTAEAKPPVKKPVQTDKPVVSQPAKIEARKDSIAVRPAEVIKAYTFTPQTIHFVAMVLENVDGIYVNESRNAFNRYNSNYHNSEDIQVSGIKIDDSTSINIFSQFSDALKATDYALELKEKTKQIVPWLKGGRYSFIIISPENLELLKTRKNTGEYRRFLEQNMPGKF